MLVGIASAVAQGHFWHTGVRLAVPQKPTLARVAGPISGSMTQDAYDRHLKVSCLGQMQPRPPGHLHGMSFRIAALPTTRSLPIRVRGTALKPLPIFARLPTLAR